MFYTSVNEPDTNLGAVRVARPADPRWERWDKGGVVVRAPGGEGLRVFRDPTVIRDGHVWRMIVGAGYLDGTPAVLTYHSLDLENWTFDGILASSRTSPTGTVPVRQAWECPQLIAFGDRHVLVVSTWAGGRTHDVLAGIGRYEGGRMEVERWQRLTYGSGHYAATAFTDADGQECLMFWIRGVADAGGAWTGALSVPYRVSLRDGGVHLEPHPAVGSVLDSSAGAGRLAGLEREGVVVRLRAGAMTVRVPGHEVVAPGTDEPVQVLVDGPVLEVCTGTAVIGLPAPVPGEPER